MMLSRIAFPAFLAALLAATTVTSAQVRTFTPKVTITLRGEQRAIEANGIPDHAPGQFPRRGNPNSISEQRHRQRVALARFHHRRCGGGLAVRTVERTARDRGRGLGQGEFEILGGKRGPDRQKRKARGRKCQEGSPLHVSLRGFLGLWRIICRRNACDLRKLHLSRDCEAT